MHTTNHTVLRSFAIVVIGLIWLTASATPLFAQEYATETNDSARYRIEFTATWSAETHPHPDGNFPTASAHFSPLIGAVHNADVSFWNVDALASAGIEQMAETGATGLLRSEIAAAIDDGTTLAVVSDDSVPPSPGGAVIEEIEVTTDFPLVTLVTMIAPSPDWFVGISSVSLLDEGSQWVAEKTLTLYPYDAGTDSGADYTSGNADTNPAELIYSVRNQAPFSDAPIGTFTFTRIDEPENVVYLPAVYRN